LSPGAPQKDRLLRPPGSIIDKIEGIEGNEILIQSHRIPISRNYREAVLARVVSGKRWDKIKFS
jgi:two-component system, LytTR family, response regulator